MIRQQETSKLTLPAHHQQIDLIQPCNSIAYKLLYDKFQTSQNVEITIRSFGNVLELFKKIDNNQTKSFFDYLENYLTYNHLVSTIHRGNNYYEPILGFTPILKKLYIYDAVGRLICPKGFIYKIFKKLKEDNISFSYDGTGQLIDFNKLTFNWSRVKEKFDFRYGQDTCLYKIVENPGGIIWCPTGWGKMVLIIMMCLGFENCKIDIVTRRVDVAQKIYEKLLSYDIRCGMIGGKRNSESRVTVITAGSLHKSNFTADIIICDECHELVSDKTIRLLSHYKNSIFYGFSATPFGRADNSDLRTEGLFGKIIYKITYEEAVKQGLVVPIQIRWYVIKSHKKCAVRGIYRERYLIWQNLDRNRIIADVAKSFDDNTQVQILVKTVEHGLFLKQLLPEFVFVYDSINQNKLEKFKKNNLLTDDMIMNNQKRLELRQKFESGELKKVISTGVWSTGIDPTNLKVIIRADATSTEILNIQSCGRVARIKGNKPIGIVCDFIDQFDSIYYRKSLKRKKYYKEMGWSQFIVEGNKLIPWN